MSKMVKLVKDKRETDKTGAEVNYMGGISYKVNPIDTLKMVTASSIFGEPQYYRDGVFAPATIEDAVFRLDMAFKDYAIIGDHFEGKKTSEVMELVIDEALDYDYRTTLEWAMILRHEYNMRLNPQVIMVRAAMHPDRARFTEEHPGEFARINSEVMLRADEPASQLMYYLYWKGST